MNASFYLVFVFITFHVYALYYKFTLTLTLIF